MIVAPADDGADATDDDNAQHHHAGFIIYLAYLTPSCYFQRQHRAAHLRINGLPTFAKLFSGHFVMVI